MSLRERVEGLESNERERKVLRLVRQYGVTPAQLEQWVLAAKQFEGRTVEELDFFARNGYWPAAGAEEQEL